MTAGTDELIRLTAREAVARLKRRELSPLDLVEAAAARIEAVDGPVNALPIRCFDRARDHAKRLMEGKGREQEGHPGWLAGLPIAVKDLIDVEGVRSTYGCPVFADRIAPKSDPLVQRMEARGGVIVARSNTPEYGSLATTWNPVFGHTANPWNTALTCGGSSGGGAAALAAGEVWLAHGTDIAGSLRIPASCCSVVGLRPSFGRVPRALSGRAFNPLAVQGPMARNVGDLALFLDHLAGYFPDDPLTLEDRAEPFARAAAEPSLPPRIAFSPDLGFAPVSAEVREICAAAVRRLEGRGVTVEEASPDMTGAEEAFMRLYQMSLLLDRQEVVEQHPGRIARAIVEPLEAAKRMTSVELAAAERTRAAIVARFNEFFRSHDLLITPTVSVPPFDIERRAPADIDGRPSDYDWQWIALSYAIVLTGCPALAMPAGFTGDGRPVGLQIVGRPRDEASLFRAGALLEQLTGLGDQVPIEPRTHA